MYKSDLSTFQYSGQRLRIPGSRSSGEHRTGPRNKQNMQKQSNDRRFVVIKQHSERYLKRGQGNFDSRFF
jgi:hypothetical protein